MNKAVIYFISALMIISTPFSVGCSGDKTSDSEKGAVTTTSEQKGEIRELTDKVAKEAVSAMTTPINKARDVKDNQESGYDDMNKALKE